jgi:hypothetical protein
VSNAAEKQFTDFAVHHFKVLRRGWPDFFVQCLKTGEFLGVEVKQGLDKISSEQRLMFTALEAADLKVVIWNPQHPEILTPWRAYGPERRERGKRPKHDDFVIYIRIDSEIRARIVEIATERGYPHTIASVTAEMLSKGLASEIPVKEAR